MRWGRCSLNFLNPNEDFCAMVQARLQKEAGRLVVTHKASPSIKPCNERIDTMVNHVSASMREDAPHLIETTQTIISNALRRRAQAVINDTSIDPQWRNIVRYALEINDPLLPDLVQRAGVPSQAGHGAYEVRPNLQAPRCTCPNFEFRNAKCKHVFAVEYTLMRETTSDG